MKIIYNGKMIQKDKCNDFSIKLKYRTTAAVNKWKLIHF